MVPLESTLGPLIRIESVIQLTGISRSEIYRRIAAGTLPKPIKLSPRVSVWRRDEILAWIDEITREAA